MRRKHTIAIIITFIVLLIVGCTSQTQPTLPQISTDYFELCCQNCNVEADGRFMCTNGASFYLISGKPLTSEDVNFSTSSDIEFFAHILEDDPTLNQNPQAYFTSDLFLLYQGCSVDEITSYNAGQCTEDTGVKIDFLLKEYEALPLERIPPLYIYYIAFLPSMEEEYDVKDITVTISGVSKTYNLNKMIFRTSSENYSNLSPSPSVEIHTPLFDRKAISANKDGNYMINGISFSTQEETILENIRFYNCSDVVVNHAILTVTDSIGTTIDVRWDGSHTVTLPKDAEVSMSLSVTDPYTANKLWQNLSRYLLIDYSVNSISYCDSISFFFWQRLGNPYEYLAALDGLDILSYKISVYDFIQ